MTITNNRQSADFSAYIEEIKRKNDIVDVASLYLQVAQRGKTFWALCPVHGEKTPSFTLNREGQFYKCFGCGIAGDVIKFVQQLEGCEFIEALEILAKRANMPPPPLKGQDDDIKLERQKIRQLCVKICTASAKFYSEMLWEKTDKALFAREYLAKRGISGSSAKTFGLGLSPDYDSLPRRLEQEGFKPKDCVLAGVLIEGKKGYYDALFNRLIIPLIDAKGEVIAFGGRTLDKNESAKYKNTGLTPIHEKNKNLFGINLVKKGHVGRLKKILVLEGYMDVISLYQEGITEVVASMGTSLTKEQARLLKRLTDTAYICYDGDAAGQSATLRGLDILKEQNLEVFVVSLPQKLDPDEYIRKYGKDKFEEIISASLPLTDYKLKLLREQFPIDSADGQARRQSRRKYLAQAIEVVKPLSAVEKESYALMLAGQTAMSLDFIKSQIAGGENILLKEEIMTGEDAPLSKEIKALCYIASCMLYNSPFSYIDYYPVCNEDSFFQKVFDYIRQSRLAGETTFARKVFEFGEDPQSERINLVTQTPDREGALNAEAQEKLFGDSVRVWKVKQLTEERNALQNRYSTELSPLEKEDILTKIKDISQKIKELHITR